MKKIIVISLLLLMSPFCIGAYWPLKNRKSPVSWYEKTWTYRLNEDFKLPRNAKTEFDISDIGGMQSEGLRYTVFKLKENPTIFLEKWRFVSHTVLKNDKPFKGYYDWGDFISKDIPPKHLPDYTNEYNWAEIIKYEKPGGVRYNVLCMLYFPSEAKLYFFNTNRALNFDNSL